ncbi:hypothetical protein [Bradyrhizobium cenepequi]
MVPHGCVLAAIAASARAGYPQQIHRPSDQPLRSDSLILLRSDPQRPHPACDRSSRTSGQPNSAPVNRTSLETVNAHQINAEVQNIIDAQAQAEREALLDRKA